MLSLAVTNLEIPEPSAVHVWHLALDLLPDDLPACREILDETEKARAARFIRPVHGARFAAGRGQLRMVLGAYLRCPPETISFGYNDKGKPAIVTPGPEIPFAFNLSHSGNLGILVVAGFSTVGVDVEACRESRDLAPIARRFFSSAEQVQMGQLAEGDQCRAFYQCWTSKEALLKAWGTGLSTPLDRFSVSVLPHAYGVLALNLPEWECYPWQIYPIEVVSGYAAAFAVPGHARLPSQYYLIPQAGKFLVSRQRRGA
jgi:4'-phosphopantetheinyl transferase